MVFSSICDSGQPSATVTMTSIVGAKSQPLHGFRLSDLKWSMNSTTTTTTHRFRSPDSSATQRESDSDNRRDMARYSSPQAAKNGVKNRMERTIVLDPAIAQKTADSGGGSKILIRFRSKEKSSVVAEAEKEKEKQTHPQVQIRTAIASEPEESTSRVWNLRQRKPNSTKSSANSTIGDSFSNDGAAAPDYAAGLRKCTDLRSEGKEEEKKKKKKAKFSIALTKEDIEEDFLIFTGKKPPRRPKKRPRTVQKQLDYIFPGMCLASTVTPQMYDVTHPAP